MGCTDGPFHHSQQYLNVLCANMMDVNRRIEAIGYAFPAQDLFLENSEPASWPLDKAAGLPRGGHTHAHREAARLSKQEHRVHR